MISLHRNKWLYILLLFFKTSFIITKNEKVEWKKKTPNLRNTLSETEQNIKLNISEITENESALVVCNNTFQIQSLEPEQQGM